MAKILLDQLLIIKEPLDFSTDQNSQNAFHFITKTDKFLNLNTYRKMTSTLSLSNVVLFTLYP